MGFPWTRFFAILTNELCLFGQSAQFSRREAHRMRYRPLRRNGEFGRVYARGKSYVNPALVLYVLKTKSKKTRVGLTATKKVGHAVQRNRARRVMKAAIDEHLDYNIGGYDLVFVARGLTPKLKSWQVSSVVAKLFAQAGLPDKAKQPGAKPPATVPPARKKQPEAAQSPE